VRLSREHQDPVPFRLDWCGGSEQRECDAGSTFENARRGDQLLFVRIPGCRDKCEEARDPLVRAPHFKEPLKPEARRGRETSLASGLKQTIEKMAGAGSTVAEPAIHDARFVRRARCYPAAD